MASAAYWNPCKLAKGNGIDCMFVSEEVILSIFLSQLFKLVSEDTWLFDCFVLQQGLNYLFAFWDLGINKSPDTGYYWLSGGKGDWMSEVSNRCPCVLFMTWYHCEVPTSVPPSISVENLSKQVFLFSICLSHFDLSSSFFLSQNICVFFSFSLLLEEIRIVLFHSLRVLSKAVDLLCEEILAVSGCFQYKGHSLSSQGGHVTRDIILYCVYILK